MLKGNKELSCIVTSIAKRLVSYWFTVHCQVQLTAEQKQSKQPFHYQNEIPLTSVKYCFIIMLHWAEPHSYISSVAVPITAIFNIYLMLPVCLSLSQEVQCLDFHFFYDYTGDVFISTATTTPIVVAKTPNFILISLSLWFECLILNGVLLFPTYWPPHFLQEHK